MKYDASHAEEFLGYLIDKHEGDIITEENMILWMSDFYTFRNQTDEGFCGDDPRED